MRSTALSAGRSCDRRKNMTKRISHAALVLACAAARYREMGLLGRGILMGDGKEQN